MSLFLQLKHDYAHNRLSFLLSTLALLTSIIAILSVRFLPMQDYPDWLVQANLIAAAWRGDHLALGGNYTSVFPLVVPNVFATYLIAGLSLLVGIEFAGKMFLSLYVMTLSVGVYRLLCLSSPFEPFRWIGVPLSFSYFFYIGLLNYLSGMMLLPFAMVTAQRSSDKLRTKDVAAIFSWSIVLYTCHASIFLFFLLFVVLVISSSKADDSRSMNVMLVAAILPSALLFGYYMLAPTTQTELLMYVEFRTKLLAILFPLMVTHRLVGMEASLPYSAINISLLTLFAFCLWRGIREGKISHRPYYLTSIVILLVIVISPVLSINRLYNPEVRGIYPAFLLLLLSLSFVRPIRWIENVISYTAVLVAILHFTQFKLFDDTASKLHAAFKEYYQTSKSPLVICAGYTEEVDRSTMHRISGNVRPFMRLHYYEHLEGKQATFLPIFQTGTYRWKHNTAVARAAWAEELALSNYSRSKAMDNLTRNNKLVAAAFDRIFIVGKPETQFAFTQALEAYYTPLVQISLVSILEVESKSRN